MHFNLDLSDGSDFSSGLLLIACLWTVIWLFFLGNVLDRKDFDPVTRLTWVVVLIFVPFFGVLLYAFKCPSQLEVGKIDRDIPVSGTPWENNPGFTSKSTSPEA